MATPLATGCDVIRPCLYETKAVGATEPPQPKGAATHAKQQQGAHTTTLAGTRMPEAPCPHLSWCTMSVACVHVVTKTLCSWQLRYSDLCSWLIFTPIHPSGIQEFPWQSLLNLTSKKIQAICRHHRFF